MKEEASQEQTAPQVSPEEHIKQAQEENAKRIKELEDKIQPLKQGKINEAIGEVLHSLVMDVPRAMGQLADQAGQAGGLSNMLAEYINGVAQTLKLESFDEWYQRVQKEAQSGSGQPDTSVKRKSGIIS